MLEKLLSNLPNDRPAVIHSDLLIFGKKLKTIYKKIPDHFEKHFKNGFCVPSFTFNKKGVNFDKFDNESGALTNIFLQKKDYKRTINPLHSYVLNAKTKIKNTNQSFGKNSIYEYFIKRNFYWINFGADIKSGFSIFHHSEAIAKVSYRKEIILDRSIIYKNKIFKFKYKYFARKKKNIKTSFKKAVNDLLKENFLKKIYLNNKIIYFGETKKIHLFVLKKIKEDQNYLLK